MRNQRVNSGMNRGEKVKFLQGLANGVRSLNELARGHTYLIRPDAKDPNIFYVGYGAGIRQEKKLTAKELPKFSFTSKDWVILIAPFERYGFDLSRKSTVVVVGDLKTGEQILSLCTVKPHNAS